MIKNIKLFVNNNDESIKTAELIKGKLIENGYVAELDVETEEQLKQVQEISFIHPNAVLIVVR